MRLIHGGRLPILDGELRIEKEKRRKERKGIRPLFHAFQLGLLGFTAFTPTYELERKAHRQRVASRVIWIDGCTRTQ
jgi:hypothetical protein